MTVKEIYKRFLIKINKNDTNSNINVPKGIFVLIFNEAKDFWLENKIEETRKNSLKNHISQLLVIDKEITVKDVTSKYTEFNLPEDFFDIESAYSICKRDTCMNRLVYNFDFKQRNKNALFQNENEKPSFEYQETLFNLSKNGLLVYTDNFEIQKQFISYYRRLNNIDIAGYTKFDGTPSQDIEIDLEDKHVLEIINLCSLEAVTNFENGEGFQLQKQRTI